MVKVINDMLPFSGTMWHALLANGVCGWFKRENIQEVVVVHPKPTQYTKPNDPGGLPLYCDLLALHDPLGQQYSMHSSPVWMLPHVCDLPHMQQKGLSCTQVGGQYIFKVNSAFGGWGLYQADLFRPLPADVEHAPGLRVEGCRHSETSHNCEHWSLSHCIKEGRKGTLVIASDLVVNWGGCIERPGSSTALWCNRSTQLTD
jgi:hypothetical protein